jgi:predicted DNA-binding protein with PD1-like motif
MKQIASESSTILVLERGEELHESLLAFARKSGIKSAWLSGLGGAMNVTLGFYNSKTKEYQWEEFDEPLEIISLTGNLGLVDGEPFWHIHGVFSGQDYHAISGHVKQVVIGLTGELHITPLSAPLSRSFDETTGLKLIA